MASAAPLLQISSFLPRFRYLIMFAAPIAASLCRSSRFTSSSYSCKYARSVRWPPSLPDGSPFIVFQHNVRMHRGLRCSCCLKDMNAREAGHESIIEAEELVKELLFNETEVKSGRESFEASTEEDAGVMSGKDEILHYMGIGSEGNLTSGTFVEESKQLLSANETKSVVDSESYRDTVDSAQGSEVKEQESVNSGSSEKGFCQITWKIQKQYDTVNLHSTVGDDQVSRCSPWFPYTDKFVLSNDRTLASADILEVLGPFLLDGRKQKFEKVVANRTYSVSLVVEGLDDLGNISAVFRSADALGFQSVHVISNDTKKRFKQKRKVSVGAEKWLDVEIWDTTKQCIDALRARGYRIATTNISADTVSILKMDWTVPTAVVFGNELKGISDEAMLLSDMRCGIPMIGMVDSLNVSVAAGILMYHAVHDRIARTGKHGDLNTIEQNILTADFYLRHKSHASSVLDHLVVKRQCGQHRSLTLSLDVSRGDLHPADLLRTPQ